MTSPAKMSLREKLKEILPSLLPERKENAIKGTELIARVRHVLGKEYSDRSIRSQFSFIALEEDSCLARVENGQGYYLRKEEEKASLHHMFDDDDDASRESEDPLHKALALAVRLYDTAGLGVFVYPIEEMESWEHPDFVAVHWPAGSMDSSGAYLMASDAPRELYCRAVCVSIAEDTATCRKAFFRALACGLWANETELLLLGDASEAAEELSQLASRYGVGIRTLGLNDDMLREFPRADGIFRADPSAARDLLSALPQGTLAHVRFNERPMLGEKEMPDIMAACQWAQGCINRGRVEAFEHRVAIN